VGGAISYCRQAKADAGSQPPIRYPEAKMQRKRMLWEGYRVQVQGSASM